MIKSNGIMTVEKSLLSIMICNLLPILKFKGAFTRNEIQPDIPTNNFGSFIRLNGLQIHLHQTSIISI